MEVLSEIEAETEAEYALERPVACPRCSKMIQTLHVVRLLRTKVNFTSNLPRRGCVITCCECGGVVSANVGSRTL